MTRMLCSRRVASALPCRSRLQARAKPQVQPSFGSVPTRFLRVICDAASPETEPSATAAAAPAPAAPAPDAAPGMTAAEVAAKRAEIIRGCQIVLTELKGLDFSRKECRLYFTLSAALPEDAVPKKGVDMTRAAAALVQLLDSEEEGYSGPVDALDDMVALKNVQDILSDIWRWRRRGGGMSDEESAPPHQYALQQLNRVEMEDIDRITSSVLDQLDLSDAKKSEMSGAVQQATMAGINGAVWGQLVLSLAFLAVFNFLRSG